MRILLWAGAGEPTGAGVITDNLALRWAGAGHEVHVLVLGSRYRGDDHREGSLRLYRGAAHPQDPWGMARLPQLLRDTEPDAWLVLQDPPVVARALQTLGGRFPTPTVLYAPRRGSASPAGVVPPPPPGSPHRRHVALCPWRGARRSGYRRRRPGVDPELLYRQSARRPVFVDEAPGRRSLVSPAACKAVLGLSGRFVVVDLNRNTPWKNHPDTIRVFDAFRRRHPDAFLFVHASRHDEGGDLAMLLERLGLLPDFARISPLNDPWTGLPPPALSLLYNAADVKLTTSYGESFGLTDAEALAVGIPVVGPDFGATPEVAGPGAVLVPTTRPITTPAMVEGEQVDLDQAVEALEQLYSNAALRRRLGREGMRHVKQFTWDVTANRLLALLTEAARSGVSAAPDLGPQRH